MYEEFLEMWKVKLECIPTHSIPEKKKMNRKNLIRKYEITKNFQII